MGTSVKGFNKFRIRLRGESGVVGRGSLSEMGRYANFHSGSDKVTNMRSLSCLCSSSL